MFFQFRVIGFHGNFEQIVHHFHDQTFLALEIMDQQSGVDAHAVGDLADGHAHESFILHHFVGMVKDFRFPDMRDAFAAHAQDP
jgi:hypothetical protein